MDEEKECVDLPKCDKCGKSYGYIRKADHGDKMVWFCRRCGAVTELEEKLG